MNHLNSVLIEGVLCDNAVFYKGVDNEERCAFGITSTRYYQEDGALKKQVCNFSIRFSTPDLVKAARKYAQKGRGVRVVGRLESTLGDAWVEAQHIEYKKNGTKRSSTKKQA